MNLFHIISSNLYPEPYETWLEAKRKEYKALCQKPTRSVHDMARIKDLESRIPDLQKSVQ